ncbi:PREDICTED: E3 ubiquitin-protein ligase AIP2 [Ipomoea nil]|uniref:E3 ubiquitin-protein ligase AIP2 n=1 Tax=Ipomoea nil TaxID=35883 RepID=UPI000901F2A9|nr:PREDICTED: E3 ubiquitin-protein ligase AIP2 [Ipomoea nil]
MERKEDEIKQKLQELQRQLGKKQSFEEAVSSIRSLLLQYYPSASPSLQKSFYSVVCRVATILKTRYTAPGFWRAGLQLFLDTERLVLESSERKKLQDCIAQAQDHLSEIENQPENSTSTENRPRGFLFEGHLTVDPEPAQPDWLVMSNLLSAAATLPAEQSSQEDPASSNSSEAAANLLRELADRLDDIVPMILDDAPAAPRVPPASKEVVAKLPVTTVTDEFLAKLDADAECAICKENLVLNDKMQELPCKHMFHPPCLKPWLDEHNSCPICRHELQTDDHKYESWKEREREAEEERKGAANAVREGEYMYV